MRCLAALLIFLSLATPGRTQQPQFRAHTLDSESTHNACAVMDVDRDGNLDVVSGRWWYRAPHWEREFLRSVELIRGRYDDYAHLPFDVNGDGWMDLISANYRSRSIYWVEHPGPELGAWKTHVVERPGAMETGRLADVDGDGRMDVLPNGLKFAGWWEIRNRGTEVEWVSHDLPSEVAGHGVGFGDVDGDGRGDIVGPRGWLRAPEDPRRGRWHFHQEYDLGPGASIPILVHDVDGDGDTDLVWGRGHGIGVYWLEQRSASAVSERRWVQHAIDTSWSQPHSILHADLNGDGILELVAGKRYMGHDGKDPGEFDPFCLYSYQFDRHSGTWHRWSLAEGGTAGFGLDPKAADLDGDGDLDLVAADRNGLTWFENLGVADATTGSPALPSYPDHTDLTYYLDQDGRQAVATPSDWGLRRAHILAGMQRAMGPLPDSHARVALRVEEENEVACEGYRRRRLSYAADTGPRVPAYLLIPEGLQRPAPAMLCLHQTTAIGKDEPAGVGGQQNLHYAHELAQRGYVCLVPDYPSFGEHDYDFAADSYASGTMKAIWNNIRGIDLLESLPQVDRTRIGCIGHSLGGHNGLFTAAFDQRLRAVITNCGFTAFQRYAGGDLAGWSSPRYMPRIAERYGDRPDRVPFDFHEVLAAIAPRALFVSAPEGDSNFDLEGVREVVTAAERAYSMRSASDRLQAVYPDCGHDFPNEIRQQAYDWLDEIFSRGD